MAWLGKFVVKHRKAIIVTYVIILIPAIIGFFFTRTNYDLLSYMPDRLNSKQGEQVLEEEFALSGMGLIMVRGKAGWQIKELISKIEELDGIDKVAWMGDYADIYVPVEFIEPMVKERFSSGDSVLLQVQFAENARTEKTNKAVVAIKKIIADDPDILFGGEPAIITEMQETVDREIPLYAIIAVVTILFILNLSIGSYLDPILFLASVGVAVLINMGTNLFLGEISFMTASIAAVMQLGISLDYSIFLMHRYEEERNKFNSLEEAMESTVSKTATAIASSALTTIGGFAALLVMQNGIGRDMGMVLGKGITISLIVNLTFLPSLLLVFNKASSRFRHKVLLPSFKPLARLIVKGRWVFLALFFLLLVPSYLAQGKVQYYYSNKHYLPRGAPSTQATEEIADEYGVADPVYIITRNEGRVKEQQLVSELNRIDAVDSVVAISEQVDLAIPEPLIPEEIIKEFAGENYRYCLAFLKNIEDEQSVFETIDEIKEVAGRQHDQYYVTGPSAMTRDLASLVDTDARNVAIVSIVCIALIIAISFKSLAIPLILILAIQLAIWINLSFPYYQSLNVSSLTPMIIGAIQLGATVDYAILFGLRYQENILLFDRRVDALRQTIEDAGQSILTSALTLASATIGIALIASIKTTGEMTMLIGRGAIISMLIIFFGLPPLFLLSERLIAKTTAGWPALSKKVKKKTIRGRGQNRGPSEYEKTNGPFLNY
jgi:predicted RND superfamily exporter protein